jgi:hypothetical protein
MRRAPGLEVLQVRLVSAERGRGIGGGLIGLGFGHRQGSTGPGWFLVRWQAGKLAGPGCMFPIVVHAVSRFPKEANRQSTNINTREGLLSRVDMEIHRSTVRPISHAARSSIMPISMGVDFLPVRVVVRDAE